MSTIAGSGRGYRNGPAEQAQFDTPSGLAIDASGVIYVADTGNNVVRRIADGMVSTVAGDGRAAHQDGPASRARFNGPIGVAVDAEGRILVADTYNDRIRAIDADGEVRTIAGSTQGLVVTDALNALVREVAAPSQLEFRLRNALVNSSIVNRTCYRPKPRRRSRRPSADRRR